MTFDEAIAIGPAIVFRALLRGFWRPKVPTNKHARRYALKGEAKEARRRTIREAMRRARDKEKTRWR